MFDNLTPFLLPFIALYPEIHYRFPTFPFSRYYRRHPEIISDAPHRLEPGQALPILLLIKDADRFPLTIDGVYIEARGGDGTLSRYIDFGGEMIGKRWWHHIEWLELPDESPCKWEVRVTWRIRIGKRRFVIRNDNLPGLSHAPLTVLQSGQALPRAESWIFGDLHAHTAYTEDQVEFGAPLLAYPALGGAQGLTFAFAADHSYDLDKQLGSFTSKDPGLLRFNYRNAEISELNAENAGRFILLPGFELSVANVRRKNVHLLLLNQRHFIPGSGDSAERWFRRRSELPIHAALERQDDHALAVAAHPKMNPPWLQRRLLGRGHWESEDLESEGLFGLQIWNGKQSADFRRGLECWIEGLLSGKRWKIVAGSDAHGNFNRYRQVGFPMLKLLEAETQIFGSVRTGIHLGGALNVENLIEGLRSGRSLVTDGPFADLVVRGLAEGSSEAFIVARSTPEFGPLSGLKLYRGKPGKENEQLLLEEDFHAEYSREISVPVQGTGGYLRLEVAASRGRLCLTNPVYL